MRSPDSVHCVSLSKTKSCWLQMQDNLDREKKVRADVEKAKRKLEQDLRQTQEAVEELERVKSELEDGGRKFVDLILCCGDHQESLTALLINKLLFRLVCGNMSTNKL